MPAALTAWAVTAVGLAWRAGPALAAVSAVAASSWCVALRIASRSSGRSRRCRSGPIAVAVVAAGFGLAAGLRSDAAGDHPLLEHLGATVSVTVVPTETPRPARGGRLMFRADLGADAPAGGRVMVFAPPNGFADLSAGQPVRFRARVSAPARRDLTVAVLNATGRPVAGEAPVLLRAAHALRRRFAAAASESLPADQAAMLPALVLGDTAAIPATTTQTFRTAGLTHLTAVSGANVAIVCGAVLLAAGLIGPRAASVLAGVTLAGFVVIVEPTASVLRAAVMGAIALLALLTNRRRQALPALSATVLLLMVIAPELAVDIGFALSVLATGALVVVAPVWSARLAARGWPKPLADALSVATAAQLATAPLVAAVSGQLSVVALAANLVVAPVIPLITVLGTAAAAVCPLVPAVAGLVIRFTGPELWWLLRVAEISAAIPGAAIAVPAGWAGLMTVGAAASAGVALGSLLWCRPRRCGVTRSPGEHRRPAPGARRGGSARRASRRRDPAGGARRGRHRGRTG